MPELILSNKNSLNFSYFLSEKHIVELKLIFIVNINENFIQNLPIFGENLKNLTKYITEIQSNSVKLGKEMFLGFA